jgi:hypothetical protein
MWHLTPMLLAPLCVPIELQRPRGRDDRGEPAPRYFRLSVGLEAGGKYPSCLYLRSPLPDELREGPLRARFHLPPPTEATARLLGVAWDGEIVVAAYAGEVLLDAGSERERREARLVVFRNVTPATRERLKQYATLRLQSA